MRACEGRDLNTGFIYDRMRTVDQGELASAPGCRDSVGSDGAALLERVRKQLLMTYRELLR